MTEVNCEHKWKHKETIRKHDSYQGSYCTTWIKIDYYFCEKCLEEKEKKRVEDSRETPLWY